MRRSGSSSGIPVAKYQRTLSSENLRKSQTQFSKPGLRRSNSATNLAPRPAISRATPLRSEKNLLSVPSTGTFGSASKPYTRPSRSISTPRQSGHLNQRLPSPGKTLTTQKINDKIFCNEQFKKVCAFLETRLDDFDPKSLKTLSTKSFVTIISLMFSEIDPRISVNEQNYKEIVLKYLKLFKYPGPVSISMLKSVYTTLSWNSIMAIFGWLVTLIESYGMNDCEDNKLREYIGSHFMNSFRGKDPAGLYVHLIEEMVDFDKGRYEETIIDCEKLNLEVHEKLKTLADLQEKLDELLKQRQIIEEKKRNFEELPVRMAQIKEEIEQLKAEQAAQEEKIEKMKSSVSKTHDIISSQPYSLKDKQNLLRKIEEEKDYAARKKEAAETVKKLREEYDIKQTDFRRQIESAILNINGILLELKVVLLSPDAKKIQLPERGFHTEEFVEAVEEKRQEIQELYTTITNGLKTVNNSLAVVRNEFDLAMKEALKKKEDIDVLKARLRSLNVETERISFEGDIQIEQLERKVASILESTPDVDSLKKERDDLQKEYEKLQDELEKLSIDSIDLFRNMEESMAQNPMKSIATNLVDKAKEVYEHACRQRDAALELLMKYSDGSVQVI